MRYLILLFIGLSNCSVFGQAKGGSYVKHNQLFGPNLGFGMGYGSKINLPFQYLNRKPGFAQNLGLIYNKFTGPSMAFGGSLNYLRNNYLLEARTSSSDFKPVRTYKIMESWLQINLEAMNFVDPHGERIFIGAGISPGILTRKDLLSKRNNGTDTAISYRYPQAREFKKVNMGIVLKAGMDFDFERSTVLRLQLSYNPTLFFRKEGKSEMAHCVLVSMGYFWAE